MAQNKPELRKVAQNKKAYHDYFVTETFEAGLELFGTEVKSIRNGKVNLKDSWCHVKNGEIFANGMHISPYEKGNIFNRDPMRPKRLHSIPFSGCSPEKGIPSKGSDCA